MRSLFSCCRPPASSSTDDADQKNDYVNEDVVITTVGSRVLTRIGFEKQEMTQRIDGLSSQVKFAEEKNIILSSDLIDVKNAARQVQEQLNSEIESLKMDLFESKQDSAEKSSQIENLQRELEAAAEKSNENFAVKESMRQEIESLRREMAHFSAAKDSEIVGRAGEEGEWECGDPVIMQNDRSEGAWRSTRADTTEMDKPIATQAMCKEQRPTVKSSESSTNDITIGTTDAHPEEAHTKKKKKKLKPRLAPLTDSQLAPGEFGDDEGLGYGHIAVSTRTLLTATQYNDNAGDKDKEGAQATLEEGRAIKRSAKATEPAEGRVEEGLDKAATNDTTTTSTTDGTTTGIKYPKEKQNKKKRRPRLAPLTNSQLGPGEQGDDEGLGYGHIAVSTRTLLDKNTSSPRGSRKETLM